MIQVKFRGVIPRAHFPRNFGGIRFPRRPCRLLNMA
jgi:hypothetical protein